MEVDEIFYSQSVRIWGCSRSHGPNKLKLLKAAPTRWLPHREASKRLVSRFEPLVNALDSILNSKNNAEVQGIKENLLEPNTVLFLLLLSDVLTHVNRFSKYLQTRNLVFTTVAHKFVQLKESLHRLSVADGPSFQEHAIPYLKISQDRLAFARRLRNADLIGTDEDLNVRIAKFKKKVKVPFMADLIKELDIALNMNDPVMLAFDVFNVTLSMSETERIENVAKLSSFYGSEQSSKFKGEVNMAPPIIGAQEIESTVIVKFFKDFDDAVSRARESRNKIVKQMVESGKLLASQVDDYID